MHEIHLAAKRAHIEARKMWKAGWAEAQYAEAEEPQMITWEYI